MLFHLKTYFYPNMDFEIENNTFSKSQKIEAQKDKDMSRTIPHPNMDIGFPNWQQLLTVFIASFTIISDGLHYGWSSAAVILLKEEDSPVGIITEEDEILLETLFLVGAVAALPITVYIVDRVGRKWSSIGAAALSLICWICIGLSPDIKFMIVARFFAGFGCNISFVAIPIYIAECAQEKVRGFLGSFVFTMMLIGIVMSYSIVPFVPLWSSSCVGAAINIIYLFSFSQMPESPYYYLLKKKEDRAENSLRWLRSSDDVLKELSQIQEAVNRQSQEKGRPKDLFLVPSNRKALLVMCFLNITQHLCATSVMIMNLQSILGTAGSSIDPRHATILFGISMLVTVFSGSFLIDRFGRKALLIVSCLLITLCLGTLGGYFLAIRLGYKVLDALPLIAVLGYAVANRLGLGLVPIVVAGEIFPTSVKAMGLALADFVYMLMAALSVRIYYWLMSQWGIHVPFLIFATWGLIAAVITYFFVPETKGKTLEQIQIKLKKQTGKNSENPMETENVEAPCRNAF